MIFNTAEVRCIFEVLKILEKGKSKYSMMFKETKFSHITLQNVLKELEKKKFIKREDLGHMNVNYEISEKGKKLLRKLEELREILR